MNKPVHGEWETDVPAHHIQKAQHDGDHSLVSDIKRLTKMSHDLGKRMAYGPPVNDFNDSWVKGSVDLMKRKDDLSDYVDYQVKQLSDNVAKIHEVVTRWQRMDGPKAPDAMGEIRDILEGR